MHWASDIYLFGVMLILFIILMLHVLSYQKETSFSEEGFQFSPPKDKSPYARSLSDKDIQGLKGGQRIMTEMLRIFDQICRRHHIRYWCMGGTLIGVLRHKGWVPWDGDIDIGMMYDDFIKFQKVCYKELPRSMWLQSTKTDPHYPNKQFFTYMPKLRHLYSCYQNSQDGVRFHNGFQLDLFLHELKNGQISSLSGDDGNDGSCVKPIDWVFPLRESKFEDIIVYIPNHYKKYSTKSWGAYPPPYPSRHKRYPHEGTLDPNSICDHHNKLYPHLYAST